MNEQKGLTPISLSADAYQDSTESLSQLMSVGINDIHILNSINSNIIITDKKFRITYINQTAQELFGLQAQDVHRKNLFEINLPGTEPDLRNHLLNVLQRGDIFHADTIRFITATKEEKFLERTYLPLRDKQSKIKGLVLVGKDITTKVRNNMKQLDLYKKARHKLEEHIIKLENQLAASAAEINSLRDDVENTYRVYNLITKNRKMRQILDIIPRVAESNATVLLTGETGTGKELIAKAIHCHSRRRDKRFIGINCAVLTGTLLESELFGHVKGSFTGAIRDKQGKFELADGGTLFLDEVSEMPIATQSHFLRVLQEKEFEKVGGEKSIKVDVRIIAATNRKLEELVSHGKFRQDLYYRLKVIYMNLPPLRERMDDLPLLVTFFLKEYSEELKKDVVSISRQALNKMLAYHWPGNVRELESLIEKTVVMNQGEVIKDVELPEDDECRHLSFAPFAEQLVKWPLYLEDCEEHYFRDLFSRFNGNIKHISQASGLNRRTIHNKMKKYKLLKQDFKQK